jgi:hypothetical protein
LISALNPDISGDANLAGKSAFFDSIVTFTGPHGTRSTNGHRAA